jgi:flagellin
MTVAPLGSSALLAPSVLAFKNHTGELADSAARLTSGNRILRIGDDVGSFTTAARLKSQLSGLKQASKNAAEGDSLLQVAKDALSSISDQIENLQSLAEEANSSALLDRERAFLEQQFTQGLAEIERIAIDTAFNSQLLLDGSFNRNFQVGTETGDVINVDIESLAPDDLFNGDIPDISTQANAADAEEALEEASQVVQGLIGRLDALQQAFAAAEDTLATTTAGVSVGEGIINDTDVPGEEAAFASTALKLDVATSVIAQASRLQSSLLSALSPAPEPSREERPSTAPRVSPDPAADTSASSPSDE